MRFTPTATDLMTAEAFGGLPESPMQRTLVRGELIETMPPGGRHGVLALRLGARLERWAAEGRFGIVSVESGFVLARDPDTVRAPDVSFVCTTHVPETGVPESFWEQSPDLAVEVVSPSETADEIRDKVRTYLAAGTRLVWVVYPRTCEVLAHFPDGTIRVLSGDDMLGDEMLLPGFICRVAEIFV